MVRDGVSSTWQRALRQLCYSQEGLTASASVTCLLASNISQW